MNLFRLSATLLSVNHCLITVVEFNLLKLKSFCFNEAAVLHFISHCLLTGTKLVKIFPGWYTIRGLVTCSQDPHTDPYPEPYVNSSHYSIPLKVLLIVRFFIRICPSRFIFFSVTPNNFL